MTTKKKTLRQKKIKRYHEQFKRWRVDPLSFVKKVILYKSDLEPTDQQASLLNAIGKENAHVTVRSGHGTGKSSALAWCILWYVSIHGDCKIPCTAPTAHQLKDVLWSEVAKWHGRMHPWFQRQIEIKTDKVFVKGREKMQFSVARTSRRDNPDALQGFHAENILFIIDEAPGITDNVFEVTEGALSTEGARVVMAGNPTMTTGYFFRSHNKDKKHWNRLHFDSTKSPLASEKYCREMLEKYGEDSDIYKVRVKGDFPNASIRQLIGRNLAEGAAKRTIGLDSYHFAPKIIGVDVAWEGDDRSSVWLRQGLSLKKLGTWYKIDNMTLGGLVNQWWTEYDVDAVFIDVGWGTGVIDFLRSIGRKPIPVNFGGRALDKQQYVDKRTEMWCLLKEWLEDGGVMGEKELDLIEDLVGPEYFHVSSGAKRLESKRDMKARGLPSPDEADAVALTFAAPVYKRKHNPHMPKREHRVLT